jgi:malate dehydrogenase
MHHSIKRIAVTGAAGNIAYSLLFRLAAGDLFGPTQHIELRLLEIPAALNAAQGVRLELEDGAYPLLHKITVTSNPEEAFADADVAILIGAKPRGPGMERSQLLAANAAIFAAQGSALDAVAASDVRVLVVGNPCNTNCLLALQQCSRLRPSQFHAMTRLDQNRAQVMLAHRAAVPVTDVSNVTIWGNHSATQVPDAFNARIKGQPVISVINDDVWLKDTFVKQIQQRGAAIIAARGQSSAASAAQAILDDLKSLIFPTAHGEWYSMAVYSNGNPYGIIADLVFSFPCRTTAKGDFEIVPHLAWQENLAAKIATTSAELCDERRLLMEMALLKT